MATNNLTSSLTLAELIRREDPKGAMRELVDVISKTNQFEDATWIECNNGTYYEDGRVAVKPTGTVRMYGQGVAPTAGITEVVTEPTEMLADLSLVDADLILHQPNPAGARAQEDGLHISGVFDQWVGRIFSSSRATNPIAINGLNNRTDYNTLSSSYTFDNAGGNASATANKTSIWIIQWGSKMVNLIYPRNDGSPLPITARPFPMDLVADPNDSTKFLPAYRTWFKIHSGIFIHDPRMIKRVVNISTTNIDGVDDFSFDENVLIDAYNELEAGGRNAVIYCNRTIKSQMMKRSNEKGNGFFTENEGEGPFAHPVTRFWGIPVREMHTDAISNTGAKIS